MFQGDVLFRGGGSCKYHKATATVVNARPSLGLNVWFPFDHEIVLCHAHCELLETPTSTGLPPRACTRPRLAAPPDDVLRVAAAALAPCKLSTAK